MKKTIGIVLIGASIVLIVMGIIPMAQERMKYSTYSSRDLKVITRLVSLPNGSWAREVEYQELSGKTLGKPTTSIPAELDVPPIDRLAPNQPEESIARAYFAPGSINPIFPRTFTFGHYWMILGPLPLAILGILGLMLKDPLRDRAVNIVAPRVGVYDLVPLYPLKFRRMASGISAAAWNLVSLPVGMDYLIVGSSENRAGGVILTGLFFAIGLVLIGVAIYYYRVDGRIQDTLVSVDALPMGCGHPVAVTLDQQFTRKCKLAEMRLGLVCQAVRSAGGKGSGLRAKIEPVAQQWKDVLINRDVNKGQHITLSHTFDIPHEATPTSPMKQTTEPFYRWQIQVHLTFVDGPNYHVEFPVLVDAYVAKTTVKRL